MLYLLQLQDQDQTRRVPVADATAAALERALLATDLAARRRHLADAVAADPALAIWVADIAQRQDQRSLATTVEAADWLADRLAEVLSACLCRPDGESFATIRVPPDEAQRFADRHAAALIRARATGDGVEDAAYFAEIVAAKADLAASWPVEARVEERLLPAFPAVPMASARQSDLQSASVEPALGYLLSREPGFGVPSASSVEPGAQPSGIEWRLPALVALVGEYERRLASFDQRLEQEKLDSLKELAYGASHEINNPLANIAARAQTLLQEETDPQRQRKLTAIHRQAMRAHEMIADLMLFARPPKLHPTTVDLRELARQVVDDLAELAVERQIELRCAACEEPVVLEGDETQLAVAIQALVTNALEAIGAAGCVEVAVKRNVSGGHTWAEVVVRDDGPGICSEVRRHMFDPFYSGREAGRGLGFGLSKCWRIVTDHGGQVIVDQSARQGAEIAILLPLGSEQVRSQ